EEAFGQLSRWEPFPVRVEGNPGFFAPFLSRGRDLWVGYAFTEEKAHRFAIQNSAECARLLVVYCHPTFTRHYRCQHANAHVVSLPELLRAASPAVLHQFMPQARFLANHLFYHDATKPSASSNALKTRIFNSQAERQSILTSQLREAKLGLG